MTNSPLPSGNLQAQIKNLKHYKKIHGLKTVVTSQEIAQLQQGMPIQKIVGFINFDNLIINVHHNVLIPRYETQEVINYALPFLTNKSKVLDLCCGSGYIGLTIKQQVDCDVTLSDIDDDALNQTNENAQNHQLLVNVIKSNMFEKITGKFDLIICNPPYIPSGATLDISVRNFEPLHALDGGYDGNDYYRLLIAQAKDYLNEQGLLIVEMSIDNYQFLKSHGFEIINDINHKPRIAIKKY